MAKAPATTKKAAAKKNGRPAKAAPKVAQATFAEAYSEQQKNCLSVHQ